MILKSKLLINEVQNNTYSFPLFLFVNLQSRTSLDYVVYSSS